MKIIGMDAYDRESVAHVLVAENVNPAYCDVLVDVLNATKSAHTELYYVAKPDDFRLWRGMEDLV